MIRLKTLHVAKLATFALILAHVCDGQLIESLYCGEDNCYDLLEVTRDSSKTDISKAYRQLARKWHPDMHKTQADKDHAVIQFRKIATAYETLKDEETKHDYDYMLDHPDEYYFNYYKYYRRRVAPKVDVRVVIVVTISVISIIQYLSAWNNYRIAINYFITVPKYRMQAVQIAKERGLLDNQKKKRDKTKTKDELKLELKMEEDNILKQIVSERADIRGGYQKPTIFDILWLQLILLPYYTVMYITWYVSWVFKYTIRRQPYDDDAKVYLVRRNLRMSQGQWEALEDHQKEEFLELELWFTENFKAWKEKKDEEMKAELAQNSRYKMHRRYMKKGGPGQMSFGPE